jgi:hypothetical protein
VNGMQLTAIAQKDEQRPGNGPAGTIKMTKQIKNKK